MTRSCQVLGNRSIDTGPALRVLISPVMESSQNMVGCVARDREGSEQKEQGIAWEVGRGQSTQKPGKILVHI